MIACTSFFNQWRSCWDSIAEFFVPVVSFCLWFLNGPKCQKVFENYILLFELIFHHKYELKTFFQEIKCDPLTWAEIFEREIIEFQPCVGVLMVQKGQIKKLSSQDIQDVNST